MFGVFIRALAVALMFFPALASAQSPVRAFPPGMFQNRAALDAAAGGGGYTGPGDVISSSKAWYGFRAYNATYATALGNIADLVDTATGAASCTMVAKSNGDADVSSLSCVGGTLSVTTFCTVTHVAGCSISKLYDQSGANGCTGTIPCDAAQTTHANRPVFTLSGANSKPGMQCTGASTLYLKNSSFVSSTSQPFSVSWVAERTGAFTSFGDVFTGLNGGSQFGFGNSANTALFFAGTVVTASATDSAFHAVQSLANGASSSGLVDGTTTGTINIGASGLSSDIGLCASSNGTGNPGTLIFEEAGFWSGDKSASFGSMHSNQSSYYGTP